MNETSGQQVPHPEAGPEGAPQVTLPPPYVPPRPVSERPPLLRSRDDRVIAGVAGGLGRTFGVDPVLFRVVLAVLALAGGTGLLLYLLLWLLIPEEGGDGASVADRWVRSRSWSTATVIALSVIVAVVFGVIVGLDPTPLIVLGVVALVIVLLVRREPRVTHAPIAPVSYGPAAPPGPPPGFDSAAVVGAQPQTSQTQATVPYGYLPPPPPQGPHVTPTGPTPPTKPPREKSALGLLTLGLATLVAGVMVAVRMAGGGHTPSVTAMLAASTLAIGLGLLVGSFIGRARWLVVPGVILLLVTAGSSTAHTLDGPRGERTYAPTTAAEVQDSYDWGAGRLTIDLSKVRGSPDLSVAAHLGAGSLRVIVPRSAAVHGVASAGVGSVRTESIDVGGIGSEVDLSGAPSTGPTNGQTITLTVRVGIGEVVVDRA